MNGATVIHLAGLAIVLSPLVLLAVLGIASLLDRPLSERRSAEVTRATISTGFVGSLVMLAMMLVTGERHIVLFAGNWIELPGYHFSLKMVFDRLSIPMLIATYVLCGTISAFASRYMHREKGYNRFFALFALFLSGMVLATSANTIETLFTGWEMVGLSSALLVAFFHERPGPVRNGLRIWVVYRISDAALLLAAVVMHHLVGEGDFDRLSGSGPWPLGEAKVDGKQALLVGGLLFLAAMGKSALVPFSGWLPRAMEGPTPSSAVFYGALSVHLGAFLLLRVSPIIERSPILAGAAIAVGLLTAIFAAITARVQTDIKSALCFASMTQVGIIVAEIGLGWHYVALAHLLGHAFLRTLQFLRAPSLLMDYGSLEDAIGARLDHNGRGWGRLMPDRLRDRVYRMASERGWLDATLDALFVRPFLLFFRSCESIERRWMAFLAGSGDAPKASGYSVQSSEAQR